MVQQHRDVISTQCMHFLQRPFQQCGILYLLRRMVGNLDPMPVFPHLPPQPGNLRGFPVHPGTDTPVLKRLMGVATAHHRNLQPFRQRIRLPFCLLPVQRHILSVQIKKIQRLQLLCGNLRDMASFPKRMRSAHDHVVFRKKFHQIMKWKKMSLLLVGLQPSVQLQNLLHLSDGQDMPALDNIRLHSRENPQSVFQHQTVPLSLTDPVQIAVDLVKLKGIEMLRQAKGIQSEIDTTFRAAYAALQRANIELGINYVQEIGLSVPVDEDVKIKARSIMGTEIPLVQHEERPMGLAYGFRKVDVFTITSCIFATIEDEAGNILTQTRRVRGISMDMEKVRMCNDLSRRLCEDPPRGEALRREIEGLSETKTYGKLITYLSYSLIAGMMAIFFGGDFRDMAAAAVAAPAARFVFLIGKNARLQNLVVYFVDAFFAGLMIYLLVRLGLGHNYDKIAMGNIMLMIPGTGLTTAVRDMFNDDLITGLLGLSGALLQAVAIALGFVAAFTIFEH